MSKCQVENSRFLKTYLENSINNKNTMIRQIFTQIDLLERSQSRLN